MVQKSQKCSSQHSAQQLLRVPYVSGTARCTYPEYPCRCLADARLNPPEPARMWMQWISGRQRHLFPVQGGRCVGTRLRTYLPMLKATTRTITTPVGGPPVTADQSNDASRAHDIHLSIPARQAPLLPMQARFECTANTHASFLSADCWKSGLCNVVLLKPRLRRPYSRMHQTRILHHP